MNDLLIATIERKVNDIERKINVINELNITEMLKELKLQTDLQRKILKELEKK